MLGRLSREPSAQGHSLSCSKTNSYQSQSWQNLKKNLQEQTYTFSSFRWWRRLLPNVLSPTVALRSGWEEGFPAFLSSLKPVSLPIQWTLIRWWPHATSKIPGPHRGTRHCGLVVVKALAALRPQVCRFWPLLRGSRAQGVWVVASNQSTDKYSWRYAVYPQFLLSSLCILRNFVSLVFFPSGLRRSLTCPEATTPPPSSPGFRGVLGSRHYHCFQGYRCFVMVPHSPRTAKVVKRI